MQDLNLEIKEGGDTIRAFFSMHNIRLIHRTFIRWDGYNYPIPAEFQKYHMKKAMVGHTKDHRLIFLTPDLTLCYLPAAKQIIKLKGELNICT